MRELLESFPTCLKHSVHDRHRLACQFRVVVIGHFDHLLAYFSRDDRLDVFRQRGEETMNHSVIASDVHDGTVNVDIFEVESFFWKLELSEAPGDVLDEYVVVVLCDEVDDVEALYFAGDHQQIVVGRD